MASVERLLQEGLESYRERQLTQALAKLKQAYQLAPQNPKVCLALGLMLYELDPGSAEAQQVMEVAAPQFPDNAELQLKLLDSYLQLKKESKLPSFLQHLQNAVANNSRFTFDVIYTLIRYGQLDPAQSQLDNLLVWLQPKLQGLKEQDLKSSKHRTLRRDVGEVYFIRGIIAVSRENKSEAMRFFQVADRYDFPARDSFQMQMLSEALFRMEEYILAVQAYETYLRYFPADTQARVQMAISYYVNGSFVKARDNLQIVLEQTPQTPNAHLYLGLISLELKNNEEARQQFQEELKVDTHSYQAMAQLASLDYLDGNNESCRKWLEKAQSLNPDWVETNMVFGLLYNRLGQFDKAIKCLEQIIKENPNHSKARYQLSLAYRRVGNEAKAKEHAEIYDRLITEEKSRQLGHKGH